jgi:bacterioferritin
MTAPIRRLPTEDKEVEKGSAGLRASTARNRQALIDGLNHDLAGEYQTILMYVRYSTIVTGPYRRALRALFQTDIGGEPGHVQFLSDKIAALGGEPTSEPRPVPLADLPREMLEEALAVEEQSIEDYNSRIRQAEDFGDFGLKTGLENQVAGKKRRKEKIELILAGWNAGSPERPRDIDLWRDDGGQG